MGYGPGAGGPMIGAPGTDQHGQPFPPGHGSMPMQPSYDIKPEGDIDGKSGSMNPLTYKHMMHN